MSYDLIIRGGTIVDGSGLPRYQADVGIKGGRITAIGKVSGPADEVIDAEGHVVAPGFIDGHTHMDAQVFWDPLGSCSCWHGVTSVVMGNCGFSLAPCAEKDKLLVMRNLERAEDISPQAMEAGITWSWASFPEYLDAVDRLPKGINYAGYVGHSALRTYTMGERAFSEEATPNDLAAMKRELRAAIKAGAAGFSTSRSSAHQTPDSRPVASRLATWDEVRALVGVMGNLKAGVFEIAQEDAPTPERLHNFIDRLKTLALESNVPTTFGVVQFRKLPHDWRAFYQCVDDTIAAGGKMLIQGTSRWISTLLSFESTLPFDRTPVWSDLRKRPLPEQEAALRNPDLRRALLDAAREYMAQPHRSVGAEARKPDFDSLFVMDTPLPPYRSVAQIARESAKDPLDVIIDLSLEKHLTAVLHSAARQRRPRCGAGDDAASAIGRDLLRLRRACLADHGFVDPDPSAGLLGARASGADVGAGNPQDDLRSRLVLGLAGTRAPTRGQLCRRGDLRSRQRSRRRCRPSNTICRQAPDGSSRSPTGSRRRLSTAKS